MNGHDRDICIKVIRETPQGALGKDAHDIVEALRRIQREAVIFKVFPQRPKKHGIGPSILESLEPYVSKVTCKKKSLAFTPVSNSDNGFDRAFLTSESLNRMPA